jgi:hypothetical protein
MQLFSVQEVKRLSAALLWSTKAKLCSQFKNRVKARFFYFSRASLESFPRNARFGRELANPKATISSVDSNSMKNKFTPKDYHGLTVNERLVVSGLLDQFDEAARRRNRDAMILMLKQLALTQTYAATWVDTLLGDTTFFYH